MSKCQCPGWMMLEYNPPAVHYRNIKLSVKQSNPKAQDVPQSMGFVSNLNLAR